jgi:hypothetical protein
MPTPSTNLSTGLSTKPTRLVPDYIAKTQKYVPLSVFFAGIPEDEAEPNSLFGFRMPDRTKKAAPAKGPKKNKGGDTSSEKDQKSKDDDKDEKDKGPQKGAEGPQRSQTSKPRPQASVPAQGAQGGGEAQSGAKQESKTMGESLAGLLSMAQNWHSSASSHEEMTTTANVPTLPVPIGTDDSDDDKRRRRKRKRKRSLSRGLYLLLKSKPMNP